MKKTLCLILLLAVLLLGNVSAFANSGLDNFKDTNQYRAGMFSDVKRGDWFSTFVEEAYRKNLMVGSGSKFNAGGDVSIAETLTIASKLHSIYYTGKAEFSPAGSAWYQTYVDYARKNGIWTDSFDSYTRAATRAEFISILANALPDEAFDQLGSVPDGSVPDVHMTAEYAPSVYKMYRAGIIAGSDSLGTFNPTSKVKRSEVATILVKMVDKNLRQAVTLKAPERDVPSDSSFEIQFIDVGQGDAALVICDGHAMVIDGGDRTSSSTMYTVLRKRGISHLDYLVATHPDADHIGGLSGALNYATVDTAFCITDSYDTATFSNFKAYLAKQDVTITIPNAGDTFYLGCAKVSVLASSGTKLSENSSIVLRIEYGETSFLFVGDCEKEDEKLLLAGGAKLKSTVLKVAHHGSSDSSTYDFLNAVNPQYSIISVGGDNEYGHPASSVLKRLKSLGGTLFRTDINGDIICKSDSHNVSFTVSKNASLDCYSYPGGYNNYLAEEQKRIEDQSRQQSGASSYYIVNTNTKKFHKPGCSSVTNMSERNKWEYNGTREWLIENEYDPCNICKP